MGPSSSWEYTRLASSAGNYRCVSHSMRMCDVLVHVVFTISALL